MAPPSGEWQRGRGCLESNKEGVGKLPRLRRALNYDLPAQDSTAWEMLRLLRKVVRTKGKLSQGPTGIDLTAALGPVTQSNCVCHHTAVGEPEPALRYLFR